MAVIEDEQPKKSKSHEIGQDLSLLSGEELAERISLLQSEIARLEAEMRQKNASRAAGESFFRRTS